MFPAFHKFSTQSRLRCPSATFLRLVRIRLRQSSMPQSCIERAAFERALHAAALFMLPNLVNCFQARASWHYQVDIIDMKKQAGTEGSYMGWEAL